MSTNNADFKWLENALHIQVVNIIICLISDCFHENITVCNPFKFGIIWKLLSKLHSNVDCMIKHLKQQNLSLLLLIYMELHIHNIKYAQAKIWVTL